MSDEGSFEGDNKSNSILEGLKFEWNLFWAGLVGDEEEKDSALDDIKDFEGLKRQLSLKRAQIFQQLENLNKEVDISQAQASSLKLVGGDVEEVEQRLDVLILQGQEISEQLRKIDHKIRELRIYEETT